MNIREPFNQSEWYKTRPDCIKKLIDLFPPDKLVRIKDSGKIGQIQSYSEDGTLTLILDHAIFPNMEYCVFGIRITDLEAYDK